MWPCGTILILALVAMTTPTLSQSGDGEWGSGFGIYSFMTSVNDTSQAAGDEPVMMKNSDINQSTSPAPLLPGPDRCSAYFSTSHPSARRLKAQREELAYLRAIQHGNEAVMENLAQFVAAELGGQSYEEVIRENVMGLQEEHKRCHEEVEKAEEDLEKQLEGVGSHALSGMQKVREESQAFDDLLRGAADIAHRLESLSQALQASFAKPLKTKFRIRHRG